MRKTTIDENKKCPKCGKIENQIKAGFNKSGTQRCKCKECGISYTLIVKELECRQKNILRPLAAKVG